jgi:hypothetical protein
MGKVSWKNVKIIHNLPENKYNSKYILRSLLRSGRETGQHVRLL